MRLVVVILVFVVAVLMVLFGTQNMQTVTVRFFTYETGEVSLALVLVLAAISGALLVSLIGATGAVRRSMARRKANAERQRLEARIKDLEAQLKKLTTPTPPANPPRSNP